MLCMVIPDRVIRGILLPRTVLETWMEHAILPTMSSFIVLHHDYMRTLVHPLSTIYDPMRPISCNPHLTVD